MTINGLLIAADPWSSVTTSQPLQLAEVGNRSLLAHALETFAEVGIAHACVATTPDACEDVRRELGDGGRFGLSVTYVVRPRPLHALDALLACGETLAGSAVLVHSGDTIRSPAVSVAVDRFVRERLDALFIVSGAPTEGTGLAGRAPTGIQLFGPRVAVAAGAVAPSSRGVVELADAVRWMRERDGKVAFEHADGWWSYRGDLDDLLEGNRLLLDSLTPACADARLSNCRIQGRVAIHPSAVVDSTTIRGPALIGAGADIRDAYIGPYTAIGDDVQLHGAELEYSIVHRGARVEHVGRRLEASVIGPGAQISSDFSLPKALRLRIGENAVVCVS